jgi:hypothetical protein
MELLDGKWLEKFFYLHVLPLWRDELGAKASSFLDSSDIRARRHAEGIRQRGNRAHGMPEPSIRTAAA